MVGADRKEIKLDQITLIVHIGKSGPTMPKCAGNLHPLKLDKMTDYRKHPTGSEVEKLLAASKGSQVRDFLAQAES